MSLERSTVGCLLGCVSGLFFIRPDLQLTCFRIDSMIFISADVTALVIQAAGGAMASIADTPAGAEQGGKIMQGGIVIQLGA